MSNLLHNQGIRVWVYSTLPAFGCVFGFMFAFMGYLSVTPLLLVLAGCIPLSMAGWHVAFPVPWFSRNKWSVIPVLALGSTYMTWLLFHLPFGLWTLFFLFLVPNALYTLYILLYFPSKYLPLR